MLGELKDQKNEIYEQYLQLERPGNLRKTGYIQIDSFFLCLFLPHCKPVLQVFQVQMADKQE